ncbi:class I SAM-dependent methyltransferase [Prosthecomicrobium pneumaticum]|uniref:Methyltransferase domain-containing protein n=1 Tax=Prosthecomicrobium pneumaticum TaxID=81895 RepID=A0A7W9L425_9HYPH|nr:class I SAM-dependent methyltransferase [Prosthecomicrobium pneumaticum]MBB5755167.1 hypothetical protein [Prosthecomicrobium pneumaticum]
MASEAGVVDGSSLLDPARCGEDLIGNLRRAAAIAPSLCPGCADYHIRCTAHRAVGEAMGIETDRPPLIALLSEEMAARLARPERIELVIAGSADTGVLSTAAHAAARLGGEALRRIRFTVLDLCPTPLDLCRRFAERHGLDLATEAVDLTGPERRFPADILLLHSVFRFIPNARHPAVLGELAAWLRPGGAMVFSNRIKSLEAEESLADGAKRRRANERVLERLVHDPATADLDWADILPRLERSLADDEARQGEFRNEDEVRRLFESSPLRLERIEPVRRTIGGGAQPSYLRKRVLALLRAP